jgi:hypothetical protein
MASKPKEPLCDLITELVAKSYGVKSPSPEALREGRLGMLNGVLEGLGLPELTPEQISGDSPLTPAQNIVLMEMVGRG